MKELEDQCTTLEQSKRLVELGFTQDSASARWIEMINNSWYLDIDFFQAVDNEYPCWTVADMMKILADARGFDLNVLGQIGIYSADEPCKIVVGKAITVHDDYSLLRDNFFEALVILTEDKSL